MLTPPTHCQHIANASPTHRQQFVSENHPNGSFLYWDLFLTQEQHGPPLSPNQVSTKTNRTQCSGCLIWQWNMFFFEAWKLCCLFSMFSIHLRNTIHLSIFNVSADVQSNITLLGCFLLGGGGVIC